MGRQIITTTLFAVFLVQQINGLSLRPQYDIGRRVVVGGTLVLGLSPLEAIANVYTKEEFCKTSDEENPNGIAPGCEDYVKDPEKKARMRLRALAEVRDSYQELADTAAVTNARDGALLRQSLRSGKLNSLRKDGKRLVALSLNNANQQEYSLAMSAIEQLDLSARKLELDDGVNALLTVNQNLDKAKEALHNFITQTSTDDSLYDTPPLK
uniref:Uncharacterized protein n=1 Tax=Aureoumbra lagunensis TaxID=44058 RepID=A0A7S3NM42_9STRA|eukprot:CAMPEP_0197285626 /NCGR_PEP_ID=MMETSP0890-20130614/989_1 /TAXON_ID=44058 ORGANISM="Aureoumbra lagunensis, Strain CCMP1510" /NCGR_SAMPLE_ID=MMETSP0890 /ASSEMBLY_ACC=CAM_ASM_000533 /LENGTH=210 /DNA_ID=CAMNT_0042753337 /DNA_START=21 /DNA_END=653 /DNA_ORIENTATION=+